MNKFKFREVETTKSLIEKFFRSDIEDIEDIFQYLIDKYSISHNLSLSLKYRFRTADGRTMDSSKGLYYSYSKVNINTPILKTYLDILNDSYYVDSIVEFSIKSINDEDKDKYDYNSKYDTDFYSSLKKVDDFFKSKRFGIEYSHETTSGYRLKFKKSN